VATTSVAIGLLASLLLREAGAETRIDRGLLAIPPGRCSAHVRRPAVQAGEVDPESSRAGQRLVGGVASEGIELLVEHLGMHVSVEEHAGADLVSQ